LRAKIDVTQTAPTIATSHGKTLALTQFQRELGKPLLAQRERRLRVKVWMGMKSRARGWRGRWQGM